ncbi:hypothetical protein D3C84_1025750 [compost metagenome]
MADHPLAAFQQRGRFAWLNLCPRIPAGYDTMRKLIRVRPVQLTEHLLERLANAAFEQIPLIDCPLAAIVQVNRMSNAKHPVFCLFLRIRSCQLQACSCWIGKAAAHSVVESELIALRSEYERR